MFVHPRSPYVRVDALRSSRTVRIELEGVVLAESWAPVLVFETGLPTNTTSTGQRSTSATWPKRHADAVPVQGPDERLLVGGARRGTSTPTSPGRTTSPPRRCSRSRTDLLLQREGRHVPGRQATASAEHAFLLVIHSVGRARHTVRMTDDGVAIAYDVLRRGTPVVDKDGSQVGTVHEVLDNAREHIFDGIVVSTP